jgi:hypothetical protein
VHYNLRLRRKRSNPEFEDGHLPAMTIHSIDEAADDLIVEDDSDSDYLSETESRRPMRRP